jgi:hypothetical protein
MVKLMRLCGRVIRQKNVVMGSPGPGTKNDCADEHQQQFTRNRNQLGYGWLSMWIALEERHKAFWWETCWKAGTLKTENEPQENIKMDLIRPTFQVSISYPNKCTCTALS